MFNRGKKTTETTAPPVDTEASRNEDEEETETTGDEEEPKEPETNNRGLDPPSDDPNDSGDVVYVPSAHVVPVSSLPTPALLKEPTESVLEDCIPMNEEYRNLTAKIPEEEVQHRDTTTSGGGYTVIPNSPNVLQQGGDSSPQNEEKTIIKSDVYNGDHGNKDLELQKDTYSLLLMCAKSYESPTLWLALFVWFQQFGLLISILASRFQRGFVLTNSGMVQFGQFVAIIFGIFTQRDLLETIPLLLAFLKEENREEFRLAYYSKDKKDEDNDEENNAGAGAGAGAGQEEDKYFLWKNVFLTYFLKIGVVTVLILLNMTILIIQSRDIVDLIKDFTVLYIIAELDDYAYRMIDDGYFGKKTFKNDMDRAKTVRLKRNRVKVEDISVQSLILVVLFFVMMIAWATVLAM